MKDRLLLSDEEVEYLIRKSKRERRCECSSTKMLLILTVVLTFAFGKLKIYNLKFIVPILTTMFSRLQYISVTSLLP